MQEPHLPVDVKWRYGSASDIDALTVAHHEYDHFRKRWAHEALAAGDRLLVGEVDGTTCRRLRRFSNVTISKELRITISNYDPSIA